MTCTDSCPCKGAAPRDERAAFEVWARAEGSPHLRLHWPRGAGSYDDSTSQAAWEAWQARAVLAAATPVQQDAPSREAQGEGQAPKDGVKGPSMADVIAAALDALEDNDSHAATVILKTAQRNAGVTACRKCGGAMKPGKALAQTFSTGDEGTMSPAGPGKLMDCMKCERCGWSVTDGVAPSHEDTK